MALYSYGPIKLLPYTAMAYIAMAYVVIACIVMAEIVMARVVATLRCDMWREAGFSRGATALRCHGRYSYGLCSSAPLGSSAVGLQLAGAQAPHVVPPGAQRATGGVEGVVCGVKLME